MRGIIFRQLGQNLVKDGTVLRAQDSGHLDVQTGRGDAMTLAELVTWRITTAARHGYNRVHKVRRLDPDGWLCEEVHIVDQRQDLGGV